MKPIEGNPIKLIEGDPRGEHNATKRMRLSPELAPERSPPSDPSSTTSPRATPSNPLLRGTYLRSPTPNPTPYAASPPSATLPTPTPTRSSPRSSSILQPSSPAPPEGGLSPLPLDAEVVSFAKVLTPSDANNGGGFSVPRFCADSIFPVLDFNADPPVQNITVIDVHGKSWDFRHIYRGTPRRHLLTTGWSRFVNSKKLVAGDSVVFIKNGDGKLFVGIRRTGRSCGNPEYLRLDENFSNVGSKNGFSRNLKGRVPVESIVEGIRLMKVGREFEVLYYPRAGSPEFVVEKEVVDRSLVFDWREGMRVKMSVETEDSSRMTWFHGTVSRKGIKNSCPWSYSPWRMLQVTWDEPEVLPNVRAVSPWQVELGPISTHVQAQFPVFKKLKVPQTPELCSEGNGNIHFTQSLTNSVKMEKTPLFNDPTFPAGMQGARHGFGVPSLYDFVHRNTNYMFFNNLYGINMPEELSTSQSEAASPPSQESIHNHGLELLGLAACKQTRKLTKGSFQLFGQIIHINQPNDDNGDGDCTKNEGYNEMQVGTSLFHASTLSEVRYWVAVLDEEDMELSLKLCKKALTSS
ncbi:uncharacterized protein A4U43_C04F3640 [Asparagus officinalis]|uniref:Auxin response factor n=1 Tax=Asparagus officinalis TaxID=4686 RepID=A0A5P1EY20_ASPOF|nr:uncharacterized protein A4U43_C04F3640 [Asparagus officinalis]